MLNKNLLLLNTILNDYTTRLFSDTFYEDDEEVLPRIYPYIMDQRILRPRLKTILEMKPDLLWDASSGCLNSLDESCSNNQQVAKWVDQIHDVVLAQSGGSARPYWYQYGMCDQPSVLFDGTDFLEILPMPVSLPSEQHTILLVGYPFNFDAIRVAFSFGNSSDSTKYIHFGVSNEGKQLTRANDGTAYVGVRNTTGTTAAPHVFIYTNNDDNTWAHILDGIEYSLENAHALGGNTGLSFGEIDGLDRMRIGYSVSSTPWIGYIMLIAVWGRTI